MSCSRSAQSRFPHVVFLTSMLALLLATASPGVALVTPATPTLSDLTTSAGNIVRGRVLSAEVSEIEAAGGRFVVTTYTIKVKEHLKGGGGRKRFVFRQVGRPGGGPHDLGALVGLPTYAPGADYVLFLLPDGSLHLTSPAGAEHGALEVHNERVRSVPEIAAPVARSAAPAAAPPETVSYDELRRAVLENVKRGSTR
jgi:hypothetical protein